jgi:hypothetical protein
MTWPRRWRAPRSQAIDRRHILTLQDCSWSSALVKAAYRDSGNEVGMLV